MSVGLLALLDDVAGLMKVAAASIDDVAGMATKAGLKASGAVIDDAAVTPRYVQGFSADRELPIVARIAKGSIINKLVFLLPAALLLSFALPWAITPLLMIGGLYLCYEGAEKVLEAVFPHQAHEHEAHLAPEALSAAQLEDRKVAGAIKTDFILSAEIMAIALAELPETSFVMQAAVLAFVAVGITVAVYGGVALLVKADDVGAHLVRSGPGATALFGQLLVRGMPVFMSILSVVGTAAMIWVGGGIIVHGLEEFGWHAPADAVHGLAEAAAHMVISAEGFITWVVESTAYGFVGLLLGAAAIPFAEHVIAPVWNRLRPRPANT